VNRTVRRALAFIRELLSAKPAPLRCRPRLRRGKVVVAMFDVFEEVDVQTDETTIFLRRSGAGPAVLMLHGFPQTHLMWRDVAPQLADGHTAFASIYEGTAAVVVRLLLTIMHLTVSGPWRGKWSPSWRNSAFPGSRSRDTIAAVARLIALHSITLNE
jgi:hypothetical protein